MYQKIVDVPYSVVYLPENSCKILRCLVCDRNSAHDTSLILLNKCDRYFYILCGMVCDRNNLTNIAHCWVSFLKRH